MSHKESKGLFRRIRSPLEHKNKAKHGADDKHNRSSSTSVPPTLQQQQSNGHKRSGSDDVLRIENSAYGDPDALNNNSHGGGILTPRSQSTGSSPGETLMNPPLPPRNPPKQPGNMADESPLYVAPADTLQRGGGGNGGGGGGPSGISPAILSNYTRTEPSGPPSRTERRVMEMHQLTMSQKQAQSSQPAQRVQAVNVIDNESEYSTPFNVLQQQKARQKRNSFGSGSGSGRQRRVPQVGMSEEGDQIIPVLSPPPDRSQTTSPSSPLSTPSSEHEAEGGGVGGSSGSPAVGAGGGGDSDYDIPWDKKFKEFPNFNRPSKRGSSSGKMHSLPEEHPPTKGRRPSPPQRNVYSQGGHPDRNSPPAPPERNPPPGGPAPHPSWRKTSSPQPPLEDGFGRPRHLPARHQSEQHRPRDGSTSPNQLASRPYGHTIHGPHVPRELPPDIAARTSSMSIPSYISGRRLPSPPRERSESSPVDPNRRGLLRPPSPPNPVHIDFSIPLCDQP